MSDSAPGAAPPADRSAWLRDRRRVDEQQEDALAGDYDAQWGQIEPTHHGFVERLLSRLPPAGGVLDAACGTGSYFPMVLASGRLLGVDHAGAALAIAAAKFPQVPTERHHLQGLPYRGEFDGVLCVDAMEFVPPEDWPVVLERFRWALRPGGGWLYLTVERAPVDRVRAANQAARRSGRPVVDGEVIWDEPDGYYHHYPSMPQVRVWLADAGFAIDEEAEGPWQAEGYAYHHVLARLAAPPG